MSQLFAGGGQSTGVLAFSIIPSKEIPGLISFRMDWLDLLAVQGTLKSLLQQMLTAFCVSEGEVFGAIKALRLLLKTLASTTQGFFDLTQS